MGVQLLTLSQLLTSSYSSIQLLNSLMMLLTLETSTGGYGFNA